jgi:asparagine synthase (glutamine-hydrolysing)
MAGIAGVSRPQSSDLIDRMLQKLAHRGGGGLEIREVEGCTFGLTWSPSHSELSQRLVSEHLLSDEPSYGHGAAARVIRGKLLLRRDRLGVAPLYYGRTEDGALCFASEVKALLPFAHHVKELLPGTETDGERQTQYFRLTPIPLLSDSAAQVAKGLRLLLEQSIGRRIRGDVMGSWLSGGLDSSTMAALARPHLKNLHTFAAGTKGAPDLEYARETANAIGSNHHEVVVSFAEMLAALPRVIYHLESFDALLVRSSIMNFIVAERASEYVSDVFSGEGGDELFAGYDYLKDMSMAELPGELMDITMRLHNTALQRVDRCSAAHGTVAHVGFLDPQVVDYAVRIPPEMKIRNGEGKWILREAVSDLLPRRIVLRGKAKFWEGAGVAELLATHANSVVSDGDFKRERRLPNGWILNSKEELLYYRMFTDHFGVRDNLDWMGRTKGVAAEM